MEPKSPAPLFQTLSLKHIQLKNRIIRSATYEGCGKKGVPTDALADIYKKLIRGGVGAIITGFVYISQPGRAMQKGQCGIDHDGLIPYWKKIVGSVKSENTEVKLFMQISHAGRQTLQNVTRKPVVGVTMKKCSYFRQPVKKLTDQMIESIIQEYALAAYRAQQAGFDGIQIHGAHGYLVHQFLSPWTNTRKDRWGNKTLFLEEIIKAIRKQCGDYYPILLKLSAEDDNTPGIKLNDTIHTLKILEQYDIDAVEVSYGTMEYAFNIIRGSWPINILLKINPLFNYMSRLGKWCLEKIYFPFYKRKLFKFIEDYNVQSALLIQREINIPVIPVGGIRSLASMLELIEEKRFPAISLSRPFICEPDFLHKIQYEHQQKSRCTNCNLCTIYCDSNHILRCYKRGKNE